MGARGQRPVPPNVTRTDDLARGQGARPDAKTHCGGVGGSNRERWGEGTSFPLPIPAKQARVKGEMCWAGPVTQKATGEVGPDVKQKLTVLLWPAGACPGGNDPA